MSTAREVRFRPRRLRVVCWTLAPVVVVFFVIIGTLLTGVLDSGDGVFSTSDQFAMGGLGVLGALGILAFTRPTVSADARGVRVRNVIGGYELPWALVREVRFVRGNPWASLELVDDDLVAVMAIQAVDKEYAVEAVRALRALLAQSRSGADEAAQSRSGADEAARSRSGADEAARGGSGAADPA